MKLQRRIAAGTVAVLLLIGVGVVLVHHVRRPAPHEVVAQPKSEAKLETKTTDKVEVKTRAPGTNSPALTTIGAATNVIPASIQRAEPREEARLDPLRFMKESLDLTDKQTTRLEPVFKEQQRKVADLRRDTALSRSDRITRLNEMRAAQEAGLRSVLTPEQLAKWNDRNFMLSGKQ